MQLTGLLAHQPGHMMHGVIPTHQQMEPDIMVAHQGVPAGGAAAGAMPGPAVIVGANQEKEEDSEQKQEEEGDEKRKLLEEEDGLAASMDGRLPAVIRIEPIPTPPTEAGFETEDEKAHLLTIDE